MPSQMRASSIDGGSSPTGSLLIPDRAIDDRCSRRRRLGSGLGRAITDSDWAARAPPPRVSTVLQRARTAGALPPCTMRSTRPRRLTPRIPPDSDPSRPRIPPDPRGSPTDPADPSRLHPPSAPRYTPTLRRRCSTSARWPSWTARRRGRRSPPRRRGWRAAPARCSARTPRHPVSTTQRLAPRPARQCARGCARRRCGRQYPRRTAGPCRSSLHASPTHPRTTILADLPGIPFRVSCRARPRSTILADLPS